ncbi:MAG: ribonuclease R [Firmicutes bacterium]|nr:ribonuclease R [Bacillota bacterium]
MKEQLLEILKANETAYELSDLIDKLNVKSSEDIQEVIKSLNELENEGTVYRTKRDKFMYFPYCHLLQGKLEVNKKGFGFVRTNDGDIYIGERNINGALNGDTVIIELVDKNAIKKEGKILKIVSRDLKQLVGEFYYQNNKAYVKLDDNKLNIIVELPKEECHEAVNGHKVAISLGKKIKNNIYKGNLIEILGHKDDPRIDIKSIAYKYGIVMDFPKEAIEELKNIPSEISQKDIIDRKNHDLRDQIIFTIDGDDTKDIDDAISIEKLENGNYKLGVHIADVSNYVTHNSELDKSARDRGTSSYLADTVIPMLPHYLSNGICSLNPNVDRLAMTVYMEIDNQGQVVSYDIFESVISSRKQMTYKNVNKILEENIIPEGYEEYVDTLNMMRECSDILRKRMNDRGYLNFEQEEAKIITDENGKCIDVKLRERGIGENMIENFMIVTNETVASHVFYMDLPTIYRIHEYPEEEKISEFLKYVSLLGYKLTGKRTDLHPKHIQKILEELSDKKEYKILSSKLLRCMRKAIYSKQNVGHYGLASKIYTHFTSPIRRYPDLTFHTILKEILHGNMDNREIAYWNQALMYIAEHSSERERASIECEREVDDLKMAEYMQDHIGEEYTGMVASIMNFGMFVQLNNMIEGLVHIKDMKDDFYNYDEVSETLRGERTGKIYKLGDEVDVKVIAASTEERTIDFEIVKKKVLTRNEKNN